MQRVMQRQDLHRRSEANAFGLRNNACEQNVGARINPKRVEMMLAHPCRVVAELVRQHRLLADLFNELVSRARVSGVSVVAQREVAELHPDILCHTMPGV